MVITETRRLGNVWLFVLLILTVALSTTGAYANQPPVADAGPSRYAGTDPIVLDGTGSYDPDPGDTLTYQWSQISGPAVTLWDTHTATPTLQRSPDGTIRHVFLKLTVTDSQQASSSDTVEVIIVGTIGAEFKSIDVLANMKYFNDPFDPNKPTFVLELFGELYPDAWCPYVNLILMSCYDYGCEDHDTYIWET